MLLFSFQAFTANVIIISLCTFLLYSLLTVQAAQEVFLLAQFSKNPPTFDNFFTSKFFHIIFIKRDYFLVSIILLCLKQERGIHGFFLSCSRLNFQSCSQSLYCCTTEKFAAFFVPSKAKSIFYFFHVEHFCCFIIHFHSFIPSQLHRFSRFRYTMRFSH